MLTRNRLTSNALAEVDQGSFKNAVISVGKDFQARLPILQKIIESDYYASLKRKYEIMLWSPEVLKINDGDLLEFITNTKINNSYTEEMTLGLIKWHKGNLTAARADLINYAPKKEYWSTEERTKFFMALDAHNKNFNIIKGLFPNKTISQLVAAYYLFKKNVSFLRDLNLPMFSAIPIGSSALHKVKKFDNILPKHFISKVGGIIRSLPPSNNPGFNFSRRYFWNDHGFSDPVTKLIRQVEAQQSRHCPARVADQVSELFLDQARMVGRRAPKRAHTCVNNHRKWLRDFYRLYNHQELLQHLQLADDVKINQADELDIEIKDGTNLIENLGATLIKDSKQLIKDFKSYEGQLPRYNPRWTEHDIQLAQLAIKQAGGDIKFVASALGDKTTNMVKHFISLYSQRLQIDEHIWQNLLSNSAATKP